MPYAPATSLRAIRLPEVINLTGLSRSQIYRLEATGRFPPRIALSERTTAWLAHEVSAWVAERARQSRGERL